MKSENISYLPGVDHLRAYAALLVVAYHGTQAFDAALRRRAALGPAPWVEARDPFTALVAEGHTGVALFMVLSGFIFTFGALDRRVAYPAFLRNRLVRTYPLFVTFLVAGVATFPARVTLEGLILTLGGLANLTSRALDLGPFSFMFWTIAVEWHFYLLFPALLALLRPRFAPRLLGLLGLLLVLRGVAYVHTGGARDVAYWTLLGRLDQFLIGMALAALSHRARLRRAWAWTPLALALPLATLWGFNAEGSPHLS